MIEFLKEKKYILFILFLIVIQIALLFLIQTQSLRLLNFDSAAEMLIIIIPWAYFIAYLVSDLKNFRFNKLFPNQKNISLIIQSLSIKTYNYQTLEEEYLDFISTKPYEKYHPSYAESRMWYILIDQGKHMNARERSAEAKKIPFIDFCIAFELKRLLRGQYEKKSMLEAALNPTSFDLKHFIAIANRWYNQDFENYYYNYKHRFNPNEKDISYAHYFDPEVKCVIEYIFDCFFSYKKPSYESYLEFAIHYDFGYQNKSIHDNFTKLYEEKHA